MIIRRQKNALSASRRGALVLAAGLVGLASQAQAQTPPPSDTIESVTVTAERRAENIMNVGINITALTSEDLRQSRIETPTDLMSQVPNLDVKDNIPGAQQIITIRGVGLDDFSTTNNSTVAVYVDDIYLASFAEMDFNMFDWTAWKF